MKIFTPLHRHPVFIYSVSYSSKSRRIYRTYFKVSVKLPSISTYLSGGKKYLFQRSARNFPRKLVVDKLITCCRNDRSRLGRAQPMTCYYQPSPGKELLTTYFTPYPPTIKSRILCITSISCVNKLMTTFNEMFLDNQYNH